MTLNEIEKLFDELELIVPDGKFKDCLVYHGITKKNVIEKFKSLLEEMRMEEKEISEEEHAKMKFNEECICEICDKYAFNEAVKINNSKLDNLLSKGEI